MAIGREKLVQIRDAIKYCREELEAQSCCEHHQIKQARKPDFKPNGNMGEGTAREEELSYRQDLMAQFEDPYLKIKDILKNNVSDAQKKKEIDSILKSFRSNTNFKKIIDTHIYNINSDAIDTAIKNLKAIEKNKKESRDDDKYRPDQSNILSSLLLQQYNNIQNILNDLEDDIVQGWDMCAVNQKTRKKYNCSYDYVESAFGRVQNRTDGMGWYGWFKSNETGLIATYTIGTTILGALEADWVSVGDDNVCPDCIELEDNSPYNILNWPLEPHFGCRCGMENVRLANT